MEGQNVTNREKAREIEKAIKHLSGAASAFEHGRVGTALEKLDTAHDLIDKVDFDH